MMSIATAVVTRSPKQDVGLDEERYAPCSVQTKVQGKEKEGGEGVAPLQLLHSECFSPNASLSRKIGDSGRRWRRGGEGSYIDAFRATMRQLLQADHHSNNGPNLLRAA